MSKELEDRFLNYAKRVRDFSQKLPWNAINIEYIGANYLEASDDLGKADERMKIKISRRESKESVYFVKSHFNL
jgi:hypothetical protein